MAKFQKFTVSTEAALAAAILAFEQNGNTIVREPLPEQVDNRQFIIDYFNCGKNPTEEQLFAAENLKNALLQRIMLNELKGIKSNEFLVTMTDLIKSDKVSNTQFGLIAWAPKLRQDIAKQDNVREELLTTGAGSRYVGQIGKRINLDIKIVSCRYLQQYNSYVHQATDENGNLISFFNKRQVNGGKIQGRVKSHRQDHRLGNAFVTSINYVKELKNGS